MNNRGGSSFGERGARISKKRMIDRGGSSFGERGVRISVQASCCFALACFAKGAEKEEGSQEGRRISRSRSRSRRSRSTSKERNTQKLTRRSFWREEGGAGFVRTLKRVR